MTSRPENSPSDSGRQEIMARVRAALGASARDDTRRARAEARLADHEPHLVPSRVAGKSSAELVAGLRNWLQAAGAEPIEIADSNTVPAAVADYLRTRDLPARVRMGSDPWLAAMPWAAVRDLEVGHGRAEAADPVGITHALAAIAETGTMVIASGPHNPVTLSFLPEIAIVAVRLQEVVCTLENAMALMRAISAGAGGLPRTLNLISGPSRSADIGGIPVLGAHGPRRLCVLVVG